MAQKNIIELNGKTYDALTGALLGESRIKAAGGSRDTLRRQGRTIDGFVRNNGQAALAPKVNKPAPATIVPAPTSAHAHKKLFDVQRTPKSTIKPHQPERPKTLMRHVVKKPHPTIKPAIKTTSPSEMMARPTSTIAKPLEKKMSVTQVNPVRLARSRHVAKSHHIHRFTQERTSTPAQPISVVQPKAPTIQRTNFAGRPIVSRATPQRSAPHYATNSPAKAVAPQVQSTTKDNANDIFEAALAHATSHEQIAPKHISKRQTVKRKRLVNALAGVGAFLLIGGFIGYLNLTNIELHVASMRAGFHAEMPAYQPTGFALEGGIESSEGRVAMNFRSGDSIYTVTQEASELNSSTLLDQSASERGAPSQTIQSKGRTIFIYDNSNATWVNGGVRYQVTGNAALDADELVSLATSM